MAISWMYYSQSRWHSFDPYAQAQLETLWYSNSEGWLQSCIGQIYYKSTSNSLYCSGYYYDIRRCTR
ncbi:hypothetical protein BJ944DRAFT_273290 [Cunninghamella echinulata]|nr:hypothetical protein BJ944DRAFT_273290 [Cunninghamella echinulata]